MKPKIIPVIHYENDEQVMRNAERVFDAGCEGVFLIHMDCNVDVLDDHNVEREHDVLAPVGKMIKAKWPTLLVGLNYLQSNPADAVASNIRNKFDMTWTDAQLTHSKYSPWTEAQNVREALSKDPEHLVFSGVAFKHQKADPDPVFAAQKAVEFGFIPTTSGAATGVAAKTGKVETLRLGLGEHTPLAIASGVTPENVHTYAPHLSHILVATGVSSSFYEFDFELLYQLRVLAQTNLVQA